MLQDNDLRILIRSMSSMDIFFSVMVKILLVTRSLLFWWHVRAKDKIQAFRFLPKLTKNLPLVKMPSQNYRIHGSAKKPVPLFSMVHTTFWSTAGYWDLLGILILNWQLFRILRSPGYSNIKLVVIHFHTDVRLTSSRCPPCHRHGRLSSLLCGLDTKVTGIGAVHVCLHNINFFMENRSALQTRVAYRLF